MPKLFSPEEVRKLTGEFSRQCAEELLRAGRLSDKRGTRVDFKAHKECIKRKWREEIMKRIRGGA